LRDNFRQDMHNRQSDGRGYFVDLWLHLKFMRYNFNFTSNLRLYVPCPTLQIRDRYIDSSRPCATPCPIDSVICDSHFSLYGYSFLDVLQIKVCVHFSFYCSAYLTPYFLFQLSTYRSNVKWWYSLCSFYHSYVNFL